MPVVPIAAPIQFQLPFGFGVNVSGLSVQGPLGNRVEIGDQGSRQTQPAPITISEENKARDPRTEGRPLGTGEEDQQVEREDVRGARGSEEPAEGAEGVRADQGRDDGDRQPGHRKTWDLWPSGWIEELEHRTADRLLRTTPAAP